MAGSTWFKTTVCPYVAMYYRNRTFNKILGPFWPRMKSDSNPGRFLKFVLSINCIEKIHSIVKLMADLSVCVAKW